MTLSYLYYKKYYFSYIKYKSVMDLTNLANEEKTIKSLAQLEYAQRFCHYGVSL